MHLNVVEWVQESKQRWQPDSESQGGPAPATLGRVAGLKYRMHTQVKSSLRCTVM
jgi:hypothetical protein